MEGFKNDQLIESGLKTFLKNSTQQNMGVELLLCFFITTFLKLLGF
jgi:hypothetical protein